jgi:hypothetical protein
MFISMILKASFSFQLLHAIHKSIHSRLIFHIPELSVFTPFSEIIWFCSIKVTINRS